MTYLRKQGSSVIYLDDMLLVSSSRQECVSNVKASIEVLERLGFIINYDKSKLDPEHRTEFLGIMYDTIKMSLELPKDKNKNYLVF